MRKNYFINNFLVSITSIFVLVSILASSIYAQETTLQKVQNLNNPSIANKIKVYYSPGYEKRALELRGMIEDAMKFYEHKLKVREEVNLAVLSPENGSKSGFKCLTAFRMLDGML